ncbi:uncharacterized protein LOC134786922 [Penaeus indicus]|uniref:uncharacterized protein LOC134786922 n=1 Tax=Penaeus indicus TaxID=29960 RepID=UPI00300CB9B0
MKSCVLLLSELISNEPTLVFIVFSAPSSIIAKLQANTEDDQGGPVQDLLGRVDVEDGRIYQGPGRSGRQGRAAMKIQPRHRTREQNDQLISSSQSWVTLEANLSRLEGQYNEQ